MSSSFDSPLEDLLRTINLSDQPDSSLTASSPGRTEHTRSSHSSQTPAPTNRQPWVPTGPKQASSILETSQSSLATSPNPNSFFAPRNHVHSKQESTSLSMFPPVQVPTGVSTAKLKDFSVSDVSELLSLNGLEEYASSFREEHIDGPSLLSLDARDLKELGMKIGHRKKLESLIEQMNPYGTSRKGTTLEGASPTITQHAKEILLFPNSHKDLQSNNENVPINEADLEFSDDSVSQLLSKLTRASQLKPEFAQKILNNQVQSQDILSQLSAEEGSDWDLLEVESYLNDLEEFI